MFVRATMARLNDHRSLIDRFIIRVMPSETESFTDREIEKGA